VTAEPFLLAGFEVSAFAVPFEERFSGLGLTVLAGFVASDPVVTSLAGFAGGRRPHAPGAALRSLPPSGTHRLSRDAPRSPARCAAKAIPVVPGLPLVVFFFAQDVAHTDEGYSASRRDQRPGPYSRWPVFR